MKTWADVRERARRCPVLYRVVEAVETGQIDREAALLSAVCLLSDARIDLIQTVTENLNRQLPRPVVEQVDP